MWIEVWALKDKEVQQERAEKTEKELTFEKADKIEASNTLKKNEVAEASEKELFELRQLLEAGVYDQHTAELIKQVVNSESISAEEIESIFELIDEIEENKKIDNYLPKELRITKTDYQNALTDPSVRDATITKLDTALTHISKQVDPHSGSWVNLFSWFLAVLDKNLVTIQEAHIDIKHSIEKVEEAAKPDWATVTFWEKIVKFCKELFVK